MEIKISPPSNSSLDLAPSSCATTRVSPYGRRTRLDNILEAIEPIDLRHKYNLSNRNTITKNQESAAVIEEILEVASRLAINLSRFDHAPYFFNQNFWEPIPSSKLTHFLLQATQRVGLFDLDHKHHSFQTDLHAQFLSRVPESPEPSDGGKIILNFANGSLDFSKSKRSLRAPRPDDYLRYKLPFNYSPAADCPKWQRFLDEVIPAESSQKRLSEFFGYVLTDLKLEKSLFLFGSGANGKSVVFDVMSSLFGRENISNYDLSDLCKDTYRTEIAHKLLNYSSELSRGFDIETFKKMASGEPITAKFLYKQPFQIYRYAKLAFNCNKLPSSMENTEAFFRRLLVIPFQKMIDSSKIDPSLAKSIVETELPGIFNWVLAGLDRLVQNRRFTDSLEADTVVEKYRADSAAGRACRTAGVPRR